MSRPLLYAHRGAAAEQPENTIPSFHRAMELGADALEMDAHMTSDGHVVISHDPTGERMCGRATAIRDATLAEVQQWDAGWGFVDEAGGRPFRDRGIRVPTLAHVLSEFPEVPFNIDLKQSRPSIVERTLGLLRDAGAQGRVTLASFSLRTLIAVRRANYGGPTALSQAEAAALLFAPRRVFAALPLVGVAAQVPVSVGPLRFDSHRVIAKAHALGLRIDFWTINDPAQARQLLQRGADGIMTDDPAAIAPVFAELD
jgi:glycerophosphoryl diester phosphodiesterase